MTSPVRVKICGITNVDDALAAAAAGAAAVGFNFCLQSRRYVRPDVAKQIVARLPGTICTVGVFVNETRDTVAAIAAEVGLAALQFHGDEPPAFCTGWKQKVIKALRVRDRGTAALARAYSVDFILADAYVEGRPGGTGIRIDPVLLSDFDRSRLILAGGLTADTVAEAVRTIRPAGVDVASGIEILPGKKDRDLMKHFIANAHAA